ncbi:MAG TPA: hypothetical protein VNL35_17390 [Chloroflexota bacterium]|nr:hypothetical protein [Chloroflexota bacterium]
MLIGFAAARTYLDFDGHPSTIYVRSQTDQVAAVQGALFWGLPLTLGGLYWCGRALARSQRGVRRRRGQRLRAQPDKDRDLRDSLAVRKIESWRSVKLLRLRRTLVCLGGSLYTVSPPGRPSLTSGYLAPLQPEADWRQAVPGARHRTPPHHSSSMSLVARYTNL